MAIRKKKTAKKTRAPRDTFDKDFATLAQELNDIQDAFDRCTPMSEQQLDSNGENVLSQYLTLLKEKEVEKTTALINLAATRGEEGAHYLLSYLTERHPKPVFEPSSEEESSDEEATPDNHHASLPS